MSASEEGMPWPPGHACPSCACCLPSDAQRCCRTFEDRTAACGTHSVRNQALLASCSYLLPRCALNVVAVPQPANKRRALSRWRQPQSRAPKAGEASAGPAAAQQPCERRRRQWKESLPNR